MIQLNIKRIWAEGLGYKKLPFWHYSFVCKHKQFKREQNAILKWNRMLWRTLTRLSNLHDARL